MTEHSAPFSLLSTLAVALKIEVACISPRDVQTILRRVLASILLNFDNLIAKITCSGLKFFDSTDSHLFS